MRLQVKPPAGCDSSARATQSAVGMRGDVTPPAIVSAGHDTTLLESGACDYQLSHSVNAIVHYFCKSHYPNPTSELAEKKCNILKKIAAFAV
jgi:hypothetical protein